MKGVVLAGGTGSRLAPATFVTNKHLLPVYDWPMVLYPIETLIDQGIRDIMIVSGRGHAGHFLELLGSGGSVGALLRRPEVHGVRIQYAVQERAGGIAEALGLTEDFADGEHIAVILGDNIYEHAPDVAGFDGGARIYLSRVDDARRFGVATIDTAGKVIEIVEKPRQPVSDLAVTGCYLYDADVYGIIRTLRPSERSELEITDVNNAYIAAGRMSARMVDGWWTDAGTVESLYRASTLVREKRLG